MRVAAWCSCRRWIVRRNCTSPHNSRKADSCPTNLASTYAILSNSAAIWLSCIVEYTDLGEIGGREAEVGDNMEEEVGDSIEEEVGDRDGCGKLDNERVGESGGRFSEKSLRGCAFGALAVGREVEETGGEPEGEERYTADSDIGKLPARGDLVGGKGEKGKG